VFPSRFKSWLTRLVLSPTEASRAGWLDAYDYFLRKLSYASPGTGVVVKSPGDTARLVWLAERYPEAKFVTIYRDPTDVFYSNQYLWEVVLRDHGLQHLDEAQVEPLIVDTYSALQSRYQEQRKNVSPQRLVEVAYADLRDDPVKTLTKVYDQLGLGAVPTDEIEAFLRGQQAYKSPAYTRSPEMEARLAGEWAGEV
jgi:hypothetical protein